MLHAQGAADLQHAVRQYVNSSAIHVEGHAVTGASCAAQQTEANGTALLESAGSGAAVPVLVRPEVTISAVELRLVSLGPAQLHVLFINSLSHPTGHLPSKKASPDTCSINDPDAKIQLSTPHLSALTTRCHIASIYNAPMV